MSDDVKEVVEGVADMKVDKKKEKKEKKEKGEKPAGPELIPPPEYIAKRIALFDKLYAQQEAEIAAKVPEEITVTLPDGKEIKGMSWRTRPIDIAQGISEGLARDAIISKVNGEVWDLDRVLEGNCKLELLKFDNDEAKAVFWHSSAHVLGEAIELHCGGCLCYGPPIEDGFYYDTYLPDGKALSEEHFKPLEELAARAVKEKQLFQRLVMTKEDLLEMFSYNIFKQRIINEKITTPTTTVYRCGPLIDLCRGPHIRDTGKIKAFTITKASATYWEGNAAAESLQRVYGISFPSKDQLKEWKKLMEEAAARDHRKIGKDQELFFFNDLSPGSCFFTPHGARIYNNLVELMRSEYRRRGFQEVVTPNIFNSKLWETSGHWQHYKDDMFSFEVEKETFALKPMNCPGHCVMFGHRVRSYKELPLRFADFGVLHRNEAAGSLTGLTRVRRFQQDDAHIFCMPSQIEAEINNAIGFLTHVYSLFGFTFELNLSTRPEKFLGEIEVWDRAEAALKNALDNCGHPWNLNPGDGAFYGPKIDIKIRDALKRKHQCATIQLDFQLPRRFGLEYTPPVKEEGVEYRPVIIHRAILGSVERMIAILTENFAGKWPFWLSPRQVMVIPVHQSFDDYAHEVSEIFHNAGFQTSVDTDSGFLLPKKVRNAQVAQYNYILVVGEKEKESRSVAVRLRDGTQAGVKTIDELLAHLRHLQTDRVLVDPMEKGGEAKAEGKAEAAEGAAGKDE